MTEKDQLIRESRLFCSVDIASGTVTENAQTKVSKLKSSEVTKPSSSTVTNTKQRKKPSLKIKVEELTKKRKKMGGNGKKEDFSSGKKVKKRKDMDQKSEEGDFSSGEETADASQTWESDSNTSEEDGDYNAAEEQFFEKVQMDVDDLSDFDTASENEDEENILTSSRRNDMKWEDYYQQPDLHHFREVLGPVLSIPTLYCWW